MQKIILMGAVGCGKTSLIQAMRGEDLNYNKTQTLEFIDEMIDTPGEYILHRKFIQSLTVTAAEADVVGLVQSVSEHEQIFSQGFGAMYPKTVIGIVTKMDLATDDAEIRFVETQLKEAGAERIFYVSSKEKVGLEKLHDFLSEGETIKKQEITK
ncbi:ethanolamine utilization protein EutP [Pilibacter termitis]|uniref:Ethanolamine utilization protein EutP n=1 Tax=Pilibacter termitis TaxID=263852 RepID=A0A1T4K6T4_9ENTE|nr:EutP/PduV family microcompartment system protein [Pilibacter termitis]SJZ38121.1 ethanolamine utilization protein EutP [Pilibacter termitis]